MVACEGCRSIGFSVTPVSVTVQTTDGQTVTLVRAGETLIDSVPAIVGIDENDHEWPLVVNEQEDEATIGNDWQAGTGAPVSLIQDGYIVVIDSEGVYVNPQLMPWLIAKGGTPTDTLPSCYVTLIGGDKYKNLGSVECYQAQRLSTYVEYQGRHVFFTTHDGEYQVNCNADGFATNPVSDYTARCSNERENWSDYCNYNVLKSLGAPLSIFET